LKLFASLYDVRDINPIEAKIPVIHCQEILEVLRKFAKQSVTLANIKDDLFETHMWDETNAQKDGIIAKSIIQPHSPIQLIISGPHISVSNPFEKNPNEGCKSKGDYSNIDLTNIKDTNIAEYFQFDKKKQFD